MIIIDGSCKEGGGQIIRSALALSALTGRPFRAEKIRSQRPVPGLKRQHMACINALRKLTGARVDGCEPGSASIGFAPGRLIPATLAVDIGTAGSITLLLQSLVLPAMFADSAVCLKVTGGTDTKWSIPIDFFSHLIVPYFNAFARVESHTVRRGFFPRGQGRVDVRVNPVSHISDFDTVNGFVRHLRSTVPPVMGLEKSPLIEIRGIASASESLKPAEVSKRMIQGAVNRLAGICPVHIREEYCPAASPGAVITLWAIGRQGISMGADSLGERGKRAETVGETAALKLMELLRSDAGLDSHLADNLIPLMALAGGEIKPDRISNHIRSNIYVCEKFLDVTFHVDEHRRIISVD